MKDIKTEIINNNQNGLKTTSSKLKRYDKGNNTNTPDTINISGFNNPNGIGKRKPYDFSQDDSHRLIHNNPRNIFSNGDNNKTLTGIIDELHLEDHFDENGNLLYTTSYGEVEENGKVRKTTTYLYPDGSKKLINEIYDGTQLVSTEEKNYNKYGDLIAHYENGKIIFEKTEESVNQYFYNEDGSLNYIQKRYSDIYTELIHYNPDGSYYGTDKLTKNPDGSLLVIESTDGTIVTYHRDGSYTQENIDGSVVERDKNGNIISEYRK